MKYSFLLVGSVATGFPATAFSISLTATALPDFWACVTSGAAASAARHAANTNTPKHVVRIAIASVARLIHARPYGHRYGDCSKLRPGQSHRTRHSFPIERL